MPRNLSKQWKRAIALSLIICAVSSLFIIAKIQHETITKVAWSDIGHIIYILPLWTGQHWSYRYDIKTEYGHGIITLREEGLPQANLGEPDPTGLACTSYSFRYLTLNQTVGITYYPSCGYWVVPLQ